LRGQAAAAAAAALLRELFFFNLGTADSLGAMLLEAGTDMDMAWGKWGEMVLLPRAS
jgi:hypothetical protein